ncbi:MAG: hypothetical protein ACYDEJ_02280 [Desulfitobacteriaceae bacterium]
MKNKVEISLKSLLFLIFVCFATGVFITLSGLLAASIKAASKDYVGPIIGGLGNVIGGCISAIVAYIVAAFQVRRSLEMARGKNSDSNYSVLRLIKVELQTNLNLVSKYKQDYISGSYNFLDYVSTDNWEKCSSHLGREITDETVSLINSSYNQLRLLKSHLNMTDQTYNEIVTDITDVLNKIQSELSNLRS